MNAADRLIVALDAPDAASAEKLVRALSPVVRNFKVGKELFTACGPSVVDVVRRSGGRVFLDLKFHDIPNTVAGACAAGSRIPGVFMLNVHAAGGRAMLEAAAKAVRENAKGPEKPLLIAVTVLTSLSAADLKETGVDRPLEEHVEALAVLAKSAGLDGVVASPRETALIRKTCGKNFKIVTPGVRPAWAATGDQKRVMTPGEAVAAGADYLVVGRPITHDADPLAAARKILEEIA